jgi:Tol biopolymer transport system component
VRLCLQKDSSKRLRDIGDVSLLGTSSAAAVMPAATPRSPMWRRALPVALAALFAAAAAGTATWVALRPVRAPVTHLSFAINSELSATGSSSFAVSPDGRRIAYVLNTNQLFVRDLGAFDARPLVGEVNGDVFFVSPAFSPDGESIAFWSSDFGIKRIPVMGGTATQVMRLDDLPNGIEWRGDDLLFIPSGRRLMRVSSRGGPPQTLVTFGPGEEAYGPRVLPDGDHVLLTMRSGGADWSSAKIVVQSLQSSERKTIVETGHDPHYVRTGHLVYAAGGVVFAVAFDAARVESRSAAVPIIEGVLGTGGSSVVGAGSQFAVSDGGTLVYMPGNAAVSTGEDIAIIARDGTLKPLNLPVRTYGHVRVSPDGRRIAFTVDEDNQSNIWVFDLDGHTAARRLTFGGNNRYPIWSPDGLRVTFASDRDARPGLYSQMADGSAPGARLTSADAGTIQVPESWSPAGDRLLYTVTKADNVTLWTFSTQSRSSARFTDVESTTLTGAMFSPDGHWVAYATNNTLFVQPFPPTGVRYQISKTGHHPIWSRNGRELWYEPGPSQLLTVPVTVTPSFTFGAPVTLPSAQFGSTAPANPRNRDITPDGRWVTPIPAYRASPDMAAVPSALQVQVVLNWLTELQQRVPTR